jgi:hypothetical protein
MLKKLLVATAVFATAAFASAQPTLTIDDISPGSANPLLTGNNVGFDVFLAGLHGPADSTGGGWLTGGINGTASVGAFRYASDPNGVTVIAGTRDYAPNDDVTMVSRPRNQSAAARFKTGGNGSVNLILPGGYDPGTATPAYDPTHVNTSFANDAGNFSETTDGYIIRCVVDLTGSGIDPADVYAIAGTVPNNGGDTLIATGKVGAGQVGFPDALAPTNTQLWSIFAVPEPASLALLVLGGLVAFRRR